MKRRVARSNLGNIVKFFVDTAVEISMIWVNSGIRISIFAKILEKLNLKLMILKKFYLIMNCQRPKKSQYKYSKWKKTFRSMLKMN